MTTARTTCVRDDSPRSQPASPYCHDAKEPRYGQPRRSKTVRPHPERPQIRPTPAPGEISGLAFLSDPEPPESPWAQINAEARTSAIDVLARLLAQTVLTETREVRRDD
jgi:hypothetical protein